MAVWEPPSKVTNKSLLDQSWFAIGWTLLALIALVVEAVALAATTPVFQFLWLLVPLINLARHRSPHRVGFRSVEWTQAARVAVAAGLAYGVLLILIEPWAGVYDRLLELALEGPDPTFAWVIRVDGPARWVGLALFSGFVTLYSEELFFRGWLLQRLSQRTRPALAVFGQALAFTLFQSIPVFFLTPVQAFLYLVVYAFGLGIIVGTAAQRTASIWPGLAVVTVGNLVLTVVLV
jgi:membrane protease YdiL (CAAX protease family)